MTSVPSARPGIASRSFATSVEVALAVVRAPHRLEDPARAGLKRQVDVLADGVALGHGGDHGIAEVLRVRAREADPLDPLDRVAGAQELAELGLELGTQVASPGVHVLAEQRHLPHAVGGEPRHLGDDLARPPALLPAAHGRDDAVRALRVAAHRDLHPGAERALAVHRQVAGEVLVGAEAAARRLVPRPRATRRGAGSSRARTRRRPAGRARRSARAAPRRSSRRRRRRARGSRASARPRRRGRRRASCPASRGSCRC